MTALPASLDRDVLDSLVDPLTHRHGLRMTIRKRLNDQWAGYIQAGVYYAVDDATLEHTAAAGAQYYLSEDALLYAELRYDSNGRALNTGNGVWEANIGGLVNF